ncbi:MAG: OsmC family protein [Steroidobacteraceae bacterium]|jgi:organic hydroperoxide reductase OsmC/OhrA
MHPFPHHYAVSIAAAPEGAVQIRGETLPEIHSTAPPEFGGPPGHWSPETLLTAAVVDCLVLGFRAVARASKLDWTSLEASTRGTLERVDGVTRFTRFDSSARLVVPAGTDPARARLLLEKAEKVCLILNSLSAERHLEVEVVTA